MNRTTWMLVGVAAVIAIALRLSGMATLNFSALGGLAVLCGVAVRPAWLGVIIVLATRLLTDAVLEYRTGHGWYGSMIFDYGAYALMFGLGRLVQPRQPAAMALSGLAAAVTFFAVSNVGVWLMPHEPGQYLYPRTLAGLQDCFVQAIPFAGRTFLGDILFTVAFVSAFRWLSKPVDVPVAALQAGRTNG